MSALLNEDWKTADALVTGPVTLRELITAVSMKRKGTVTKMLKAGTSAAGTHNDDSVLHRMATHLRDPKLATLAVAAGADVDATDEFGYTALQLAIHHKKRDFAEALVAAGASVDARMSARPRNTALHLVCETKSGEMTDAEADNARWLLEVGADPNLTNDDGYTPLALAAQYARLEVVEALFAHGAKTEACDADYEPLYMAAGRDVDGLFELLVARGSHLEGVSGNGERPLHAAASQSAGAVRRLLALGADPGAQDHAGRTAREIAENHGRSDIARLLP
ncbi:MAG: ankyrin repeat domain-containing protein [Myxococcales bacterium]|nr:ankyrin repeat domain-containing protein [Myxococcales bacterium]